MGKISKIISMIMVLAVFTTLFVGCSNPNYNDYLVTPSNKVYADNDDIWNHGFGTDNNGVAKDDAEVKRLTSIVPSERQLDYLELEFYSFIHFGMNTVHNREWGTGKENPEDFNLTNIDTDQWCEAIKASGSKGIIFTAKHHDGFCLWQTNTTEHSIKNSPYKDGKGDVVKELSDSCKKYGLKFGVYLSPWDMNAESYGTNAYNDFFVAQLTELLDGRYGKIFSIWFDGACGEEVDKDFKYDMERYEKVIRQLQPDCVSALQGSDVRWVGNEAGVSRENEWSVVSRDSEASLEYQKNPDEADKLQGVKYNAEDVGSRELLRKYKNLMFKPAEVDVSIHKGWFYHKNEAPKELDHLKKIYYKSVGGNSNLLLNICPSKNGIIEERDVIRLKEFGDAIREGVKYPVNAKSVSISGKNGTKTLSAKEASDIMSEERYTGYAFGKDEYIVDINLDRARKITRVDLREDLRYSHRIEKYDIYAKVDGGWQLLYNAGNVGNRRSVLFDSEVAVTTDAVRIVIKQSRDCPMLRSISIYSDK